MATLPATVRDGALALSTDLAQAGTVFNDASRLLDGGLWSTPADNNNQIASGDKTGGNQDGHGDPRHDWGDQSGERGGRPVPSFWNFAENDNSHGHHQFEPMRHDA